MLLTARDTEADLVLGFEAGADDYLKKPFSMTELVLRVRAMLRRQELDHCEIGQRAVTVGDLTIDLARHEATVNGAKVSLTPTELRLVTLLASKSAPSTRSWARLGGVLIPTSTCVMSTSRTCGTRSRTIPQIRRAS